MCCYNPVSFPSTGGGFFPAELRGSPGPPGHTLEKTGLQTRPTKMRSFKDLWRLLDQHAVTFQQVYDRTVTQSVSEGPDRSYPRRRVSLGTPVRRGPAGDQLPVNAV
jgi:hypothetical protein